MSDRIKLGKFNDGNYRLRVVGAGGNVESPTFDNLVFDSDLPSMTIVQSGDVALNSVGTTSGISIPDQGFIPFVLVGYYCTTRTGGNRGLRSYASKCGRDPTVWADPYYVPYYQSSDGSSPTLDVYGQVVGDGSAFVSNILSQRPVAMMGYCWREDGTGGGSPAREVFGFGATVRRTDITFTRWSIAPNVGSYAARYYIFNFGAG